MSRHLIIFIKNPVLGKVKTRLAATVGEARALEVYEQLLAITRNAARGADCHRQLYYSDTIYWDDAWDADHFSKHVQEGNDLGERMCHALGASFAQGVTSAVIIGSDCPEISSTIITDAFTHLETHDVVIGPAEDGGYYLLGMTTLHPEFFIGKLWSTADVLPDTLRDMERLGLSCTQLPVLTDLDNEEDFQRWHLGL
jgi:rSAM/selenodomain-associated transferase 1